MTLQIGVVMDPIESINVKKDTTLAMLLQPNKRMVCAIYDSAGSLLSEGVSRAKVRHSLEDNPKDWFQRSRERVELRELDVILMRKDPPFDLDYIYTTYLLEQAHLSGTLVVNNPQSLGL